MTADFTDVVLHDVSRHYGRRRALSRVSLQARAGDVIGLLGHNGAGKSTLLALLATLLQPSSGRIEYGGQPASVLGDGLRHRLGLLGHDLFLYPELTARENLCFFAGLYGLPEADVCVDAALTTAGLAPRADDAVSGFSRGMRQRLALERALLHRPRLLLLDEPFTGLDRASADALITRLHGLRQDGVIVLLATHDLELAEGLLTRAVFLRDGRVVGDEPGGAQVRLRYLRAMAH